MVKQTFMPWHVVRRDVAEPVGTDDHALEVEAKSQLIDIEQRYLRSDREFVLSSLASAIKRIAETFPRFGHFLMEFIQNADDAGAARLSIELFHDHVVILNSGDEFTLENVASLCKVGLSSKRSGDYIGYLGVGFKSVFLISDRVAVTSGNYSFSFDKSRAESLWGPSVPWQVIPIPTERLKDVAGTWRSGFSIALNIASSTILSTIHQEMGPEEFRTRTILFLRHLNVIEVVDHVASPGRRILSRNCTQESPVYEVWELRDNRDGSEIVDSRFLLFRRTVRVPPEVLSDEMTSRFDRADSVSREVVAAFRLAPTGELLAEPRGTVHIAVFSFLPIRDIATGLQFTIQGDFLTGPGRSSVQYDARWNHWMADEILSLIREVCVPAFLENPLWASTFSPLLDAGTSADPIFGLRIAQPLRKALQSDLWYLTERGERTSLDRAVSIDASYRSQFTDDDISKIYPDCKILDPKIKLPPGLSYLSKSIQNETEYWDHIRRLAPTKAVAHDAKWFESIYRREPGPPNGIDGFGPILTDDFLLVERRKVYRLSPSTTLPKSIRELVTIAHPVFVASSWSGSIPELDDKSIAQLVSLNRLPNLQTEWPSLDREARILKLHELFDMWRAGQVRFPALAFLTLPARGGGWRAPNQLLFSAEYGPTHRLDELEKLDLFDLKFSSELGFLDPGLLSSSTSHDLPSWREFLAGLGVDRELDEHPQKISQRVGVKCVLRYERDQGRLPVELEESAKRGYDIESTSTDGVIRLIEAKGSKDSKPEVPLTVNEFRILKIKGDSYFVYCVANAWTTPELYVLGGDRLIDPKLEYAVSIPFAKWIGLSKGPVTFPKGA